MTYPNPHSTAVEREIKAKRADETWNCTTTEREFQRRRNLYRHHDQAAEAATRFTLAVIAFIVAGKILEIIFRSV